MRECGSCSLCCKLERINEFDKPARCWCEHAFIAGSGCAIFGKPERPQVCNTFSCLWRDGKVPEEMRPDQIGAYAVDKGTHVKVAADTASTLKTHSLVDYFVEQGRHVLLVRGMTLEFCCGEGKAPPLQIELAWTLY